MFTFDKEILPTYVLVAVGTVICLTAYGWKFAAIFVIGAFVGSIRVKFKE